MTILIEIDIVSIMIISDVQNTPKKYFENTK